MDRETAIREIRKVDEEHEEIYIGIFPKVPLSCDLCHQPRKVLWRDMEVEMDLCGGCQRIVDRLKKMPDAVL